MAQGLIPANTLGLTSDGTETKTLLLPLFLTTLSQGLHWFAKDSRCREAQSPGGRSLQRFGFVCVCFRDISPAPSAPIFIWVSIEMTARPKDGVEGLGSATAALHWFMGGQSPHPRSYFDESDQERVSLQRKQKAFNPLISGI